jgi:hypothetical protein
LTGNRHSCVVHGAKDCARLEAAIDGSAVGERQNVPGAIS